MKIAVFADSHHYNRAMLEAVELEKPDAVFHLGDHEADAFELEREFPSLTVYSVPGNCDLFPRGETRLLVPLAGKTIFAAHGHTFYVKSGLDSIITNALYSNADILLFGHTHQPFYDMVSGLHVINPGSIGYGMTYGILKIESGVISYTPKQLAR